MRVNTLALRESVRPGRTARQIWGECVSKLSIIVATYRMQREAPRTVRSLLPPLQQCVDPVDYEIVVVDNGSPERLDIDQLAASSRGRVRVVRIKPEDAWASPVRCINEAVRQYATGDLLMVCVDGARLASSHLVCRSVDALTRHPDAFVFTASRHLGSKLQKLAIEEGYNQAMEDELLHSSGWLRDSDSLYSISVPAGAHDPSRPLLQNESNAFALSRSLWESVGGYNEQFERPSGGFCNLELFSRYVTRADALNILLLGEATFHQVHRVPLRPSAFGKEVAQEYLRIFDVPYRRPDFDFLADLGVDYGRMKAVGPVSIGQDTTVGIVSQT